VNLWRIRRRASREGRTVLERGRVAHGGAVFVALATWLMTQFEGGKAILAVIAIKNELTCDKVSRVKLVFLFFSETRQ